jgi:hypothetical protein
MAPNDPERLIGSDEFHARLGTLANAIEELPPVDVEAIPAARSARHVYWLIGALCALTIGVAEVGLVMRGDAPPAPAPPTAVAEAFQNDRCAQRMIQIMQAINAYSAQHGSPPPALAALQPDYLPFAPIDPTTNQPYGYEVIGAAVSLSCPSAG